MWGNIIQVDWAEPEKDVDEETMQRVRVLYVRNLMLHTTEETLCTEFSRLKPGSVERVKKLSDYAFIHFYTREDALAAQQVMKGKLIDGSPIEVTLAKPVSKEGGRRSGIRANHNGALAGSVTGDINFLSQNNDDSGISLCSGIVGDGFSLHPLSLTPHLESLYPIDTEPGLCPYFPGSSLVPTSLQSLKPSQFSSAVSLLEYYCQKKGWSQPEYYLYSTGGHEDKMLLIYKVVISSNRSSYMPDKVCSILDDAKELAAQNALWNLGKSDCVPSMSRSYFF